MNYLLLPVVLMVLLGAACAADSKLPGVPDFRTALACDGSSLTLEDAREGKIPEPDNPRMQLIRQVARDSSDEEVKAAAEDLLRAARQRRRKELERAAASFVRVCQDEGWKPIGSRP